MEANNALDRSVTGLTRGAAGARNYRAPAARRPDCAKPARCGRVSPESIMRTILAIMSLVVVPTAATALDASDTGTYALIHVDGHVTSKVFRIFHDGERWRVEDRIDVNTWQDVTCETDCVLRDSSAAEVEFAVGSPAPSIKAECVQNSAFAFCRVSESSIPDKRNYLFVAFVEGRSYQLRLQRLDE